MPVTVEESIKYRDFVSRIARENGCFDYQRDQIVWHYTDGPGLLGIPESSRLHATQVSALNDAKETRHASELFIAAIRQLIDEHAAEPDVVAFLNALIGFSEEDVEAHARSKFFVVCFSGEEDDLTQWERYGKQNGYALGFYARGLNREPNSTLYRVIYDAEKQELAARELAEATVDFYLEGLTGDRLENPEQWMRDFLTAWDEWVYKLAPLAKAHKWRAENEYRIVHELKLAEFPDVRFKAKSTMLARYLPLDTPSWMPRRAGVLPLAKIWIGPGSHQQASKTSIGLLLDQMGYSGVTIETSQIPLQHI
ncbi:MAG TPA: DUF2971 domain-containing protein [Bryobacteraceae bacterium]|jgi:hypothetical protein|nr:DUF2971 domain-containing protein [Bryobacteraceae bacterium]